MKLLGREVVFASASMRPGRLNPGKDLPVSVRTGDVMRFNEAGAIKPRKDKLVTGENRKRQELQ